MFSFVFPGQGSQQPGMGKFLYDNFAIAKQHFEEASDTLKLDFKKLCFEGSESELSLTENTQPALLLVSSCTAQALKTELGLVPQALAGHSIGEYAALVFANVIHFSAAIRAVRLRGQAMQQAVPLGQGGMTAVLGLSDQEVTELCQFAEKQSGASPLSPANFNSPGQVVISGSKKALDWLQSEFKAEMLWPGQPKRVKLIPLSVSAPFHCELMAPAEEKMAQFLGELEFQESLIPIVQNLTAKVSMDPEELRKNLIQQVTAPVRWTESMQLFLQNGWTQLIECGTGKVLQGLCKKIDSQSFKVFNVNSLEDFKLIEQLIKELKTQKELGQ